MTSPAHDVLPIVCTDYTYDSELDIADGVPLKRSDAARGPEGELGQTVNEILTAKECRSASTSSFGIKKADDPNVRTITVY